MNISQSLNIRVHKNKTIQYTLYLLFFHFIHIVDCADGLFNFIIKILFVVTGSRTLQNKTMECIVGSVVRSCYPYINHRSLVELKSLARFTIFISSICNDFPIRFVNGRFNKISVAPSVSIPQS
jgi:hypothetical protein